MKIHTAFKALRVIDWTVPTVTLAWGVYDQSLAWALLGVVGYVVAVINPGERIKSAMRARLTRRGAYER